MDLQKIVTLKSYTILKTCFTIAAVLFMLAIVAPLAHCQAVDITPSRSDQAFIVLGRNLQWGVSGSGAGDCSVAANACGFNNNFVLPSLYPQESIAVAIFNSSTSNSTFRIKIASTNDPAITQFQTNQARWSPSLAFSGVSNVSTGQITINAGAWGNFYAQVSGASRIAIILSNSSVINNGADVTVSQIQTQSASQQPGNITTGQNLGSANALNPGSPLGASQTVYRVKQPTLAANSDGPIEISATIVDNSIGQTVQLQSTNGLSDAVTGSSTALLGIGPFIFNGTAWDRSRSQSSANATLAATPTGSVLTGMNVVTGPAGWTVPVQGSAVNCSASIGASATTRHCAIGVSMCLSPTIAQAQLFVNLRDGATGAGTVKWNGIIAGIVGGSSVCTQMEFSAGPICGTINTAMTLELSGATGAGNGCASTLRGYDVL